MKKETNHIVECVCEGNFRSIVYETDHLIGKKFKDGVDKVYTFFGIVYGKDDFYYGMTDEDNRCLLLSCTGSFKMYNFTELKS